MSKIRGTDHLACNAFGNNVMSMHGVSTYSEEGRFLGNLHLYLAVNNPSAFTFGYNEARGRIEFLIMLDSRTVALKELSERAENELH